MKLLLDQNISRRIVDELSTHFPGSSQASMLSLERATDIEIWDYAKAHDFVIVTKDSDFEEMSVIKGAPPKVILLKTGNVNNNQVLNALINKHHDIKELLEKINCLEIY